MKRETQCSICLTPRLVGAECVPCRKRRQKTYVATEKGKQAKQRANTRYQQSARGSAVLKAAKRRWHRRKTKGRVGANQARKQEVLLLRQYVKRYLACWTREKGTHTRSGGYFLYSDQTEKLQKLRVDGYKVLRPRLTKVPYFTDVVV